MTIGKTGLLFRIFLIECFALKIRSFVCDYVEIKFQKFRRLTSTEEKKFGRLSQPRLQIAARQVHVEEFG